MTNKLVFSLLWIARGIRVIPFSGYQAWSVAGNYSGRYGGTVNYDTNKKGGCLQPPGYTGVWTTLLCVNLVDGSF